ncbi:hypothetical protein ABIA60_004167 [Pseudomonas frederiksbergensis]
MKKRLLTYLFAALFAPFVVADAILTQAAGNH